MISEENHLKEKRDSEEQLKKFKDPSSVMFNDVINATDLKALYSNTWNWNILTYINLDLSIKNQTFNLKEIGLKAHNSIDLFTIKLKIYILIIFKLSKNIFKIHKYSLVIKFLSDNQMILIFFWTSFFNSSIGILWD